MSRRLRLIIYTLAMMLILTACSDSQKKNETKEPVKSDSQTQKEEQAPPQVTYPLTGLPAEDEINQRPVGVMINNHPKARPQSGLTQADVVYEALVEGNITRFLAIFQSHKPETIGPVRSARPYFIRLLNGYDGLYVAHGWSPQAKALLRGGSTPFLQGLYHDGTLFHRASFRDAPHNSYISFANIMKGAGDKDYQMTQEVSPLSFMTEKEKQNIDGTNVKGVSVGYDDDYVVGYQYDETDDAFHRLVNGQPSVDRESENPVTAKNVLIISADHRFIDSYPRREIDLKSGGPAYLLQNGRLQNIQWKNVDGRILPSKNGQTLKLVPGQTWINIVPEKRGLKQAVTINEGDGANAN
ncbi:DUF3048 domain-containing protein [Tuberibacillus sp. Marseille-P3662]|uniref:DUF3048 domain-containing protein n=1 Tax=Tuberibacillus sp. Marseille-P3662 TaxID=1965358 RepID=UPI0020CB1BFE|nr:DUF3048 domain-containing protein [Tuberibacillus sp. Marseille-P3662]